jgi:membrane protease YdiL (CAAX protease family)
MWGGFSDECDVMLQLAVVALSTIVLAPIMVFGIYGLVSFLSAGNAKSQTVVNWTASEAVGVTIAIYALSQVFGGIALSVYLLMTRGVTDQANEILQSSVGVQFAFILFIEGLTVVLIRAFLQKRKTAFSAIGWIRPRAKDALYAVLGFGTYLFTYGLILVFIPKLFPDLDFNQKQELGFSATAHGMALIPIFISLVVLPPLVEELLARGLLYSGLKTQPPTWVAAVVTSILFAVAHLQFGSGNALLWVAALDTFILSLVLVYLREKTGSLWPCIGLHGLKNFLAFMSLFIWHTASKGM